jgi:hypothetical protein
MHVSTKEILPTLGRTTVYFDSNFVVLRCLLDFYDMIDLVVYVDACSSRRWHLIHTQTYSVYVIMCILWRARVLKTPFGMLLCFIYDSTSRHYNFFSQFALLTSVLIVYLGWSSDCCLLGCCSNPTPLISSWRCVSDWLLYLLLKLRLWSAPLIRSFLSKSTLLSRSSWTGSRTRCPRVAFCLQLSVG